MPVQTPTETAALATHARAVADDAESSALSVLAAVGDNPAAGTIATDAWDLAVLAGKHAGWASTAASMHATAERASKRLEASTERHRAVREARTAELLARAAIRTSSAVREVLAEAAQEAAEQAAADEAEQAWERKQANAAEYAHGVGTDGRPRLGV